MNGKRVDIERKQVLINEALDCRLSGMSYREIASAMDISQTSAFNYVKEAISIIQDNYTEKAEALITLDLNKLDKMEKGLYKAASDGDVSAIDRVLKIFDHRAKILGLYAPTKIDQVAVNTSVDLEVLPNEVDKLAAIRNKIDEAKAKINV